MADVLIIDDDLEMCRMLADLVTSINHRAAFALTLTEGMDRILSDTYDVVFLDVRMPDGSGLDVLPTIRQVEFPPEVIIMTGAGDSDGAELAIKNGAWDYMQKPLSPKNIILPLKRVLQYRDGIRSAVKQPMMLKREGIIGNSPQMKGCLNTLALAVNSDANVLITGETGTGKELFARAIHLNSPRAAKQFVVVDCAALPANLVESALFGHEKGAFTGADRPADGLIRQAHGGTLLLDEVGELSPDLQKAFLRVLQERRFRPVGGKSELSSDFRLVAATNRVMDQMVARHLFRKDLLYRLRAIVIHLPPLRDRKEDLKDLVVYLTGRIFDRQSIEPKGWSPDFIKNLSNYDWPGNIRELVHTLEAAISAAYHEPILFPKHLPEHIRIKMARSALNPPPQPTQSRMDKTGEPGGSMVTFKEYRESVVADAEKEYLRGLMAATRGNIKQALRISGLGRTRLYDLMKKHAIDRMGWSS